MKSIVLLSGGLDSATNLAVAVEKTDVILGLTFDYGQRAAQREIEAADALLQHYGIAHQIIALPFLRDVTTTALVNQNEAVPHLQQNELDDISGVCCNSAVRVWVPNRNGLFINIAASLAESKQANQIIVGFNVEEAATFPDNSVEFIHSINKSLSYSTLSGVKVACYTQEMNKIDIVKLGSEIGLPFQYIWSCYYGQEQMCGQCESCQRLGRAMESVGIEIPGMGGRS